MSKLTKAIFALCALLVVLIMGGTLAVSIVQTGALNDARAQNIGLQNSNDRLLRQYSNLYNQYTAEVGEAPTGSTPEQATRDAHSVAIAGSTGPQGVQGRGVKSISCGTTGEWTIVYTDNTWSTVNGPCRVTK